MSPPGVGKGTQAKNLSIYFNIPHISTGEILREEINKKTIIGLKSAKFIDKGKLVPDNILLNIVKIYISMKMKRL